MTLLIWAFEASLRYETFFTSSSRQFIHRISMNQTPGIVTELLRDPPEDLKQLMADPRTSDAAREAVASIVSPYSAINGPASSNGTNGIEHGRLQVVDQHQEFT